MTQPTAAAAGRVEFAGDHATLHFERVLRHPPEVVWAALTEPQQLQKWFMAVAVIDGRPGGSIDMKTGPAQFHWTGRILTWDPPRSYAYEYDTPARPDLPFPFPGEQSVVRWELRPEGAGTRLTLTHEHLTAHTARGFAPGSHALLDRLEAQLAGEPLPDFMGRQQEIKDLYPAWG